MPKYTQNAQYSFTQPQGPIFPSWVHEYMANGAPDGERDVTLFKVTCQFHHAGILQASIEAQLIARALLDGLSRAEAEKTIDSAYRGEKRPPCGFSKSSHYAPGYSSQSQPKKFVPPPSSQRPFSMPVPPPIAGGLKLYLETCFKPGEGVSIAETIIQGVLHRPAVGCVLSRENWLARIAVKPIEKYYPGDLGVFVRINPTRGAKDSDVTAFRHGLYEADKDSNGKPIPLEHQYAALINSRLPLAAIVSSGGDSLHGIAILNAANRGEFDRRYAMGLQALEGNFIDPQNKNPGRLSRLPGVNRKLFDDQGNFTGKIGRQELLAINVGEATWEDWEAKYWKDPDELEMEEYFRLYDLSELSAIYPPVLIEGLLHQGERLVIVAPSKAFKSWLLMELAVSIITGLPFLGKFKTHVVPVVHMDYELMQATIRKRCELIAAARGVAGNDFLKLLKVMPLKGKRMLNFRNDFRLPKVQAFLIKLFKGFNAGLYDFDPLYKAGCGQDENSNSDWEEIMAAFDYVSMETSASMAATHHFAKGSYIDKEPMDRAAGAGVIAGRAPGVTMIFTPHKEPFCYTVDTRAREFAAVPSFVIRRNHPLMTEDSSLDPAELYSPFSVVAKVKIQTLVKAEKLKSIMAALRMGEVHGANNGVTFARLKAATEIPEQTLRTHLKELIKNGMVMKDLNGLFQLSSAQATLWQNAPA